MDIYAVRTALGNAPRNLDDVLGKALTCTAYTPNSVTVPCWYPGEVELEYAGELNTFNGEPVLQVSCYILTAPESNDQAGQQMLDVYLKNTGTSSIKAAVESDQTLGGVAKSVFAHHVDGYRLYTVGGVAYFGARFRVQVLGG